jgi:uncharacterized membrane protein YphA (DoxX/SURF4 family)
MGLVVVRIALGVFFLFEGIGKIGWLADSDLLTDTLKGWLAEAPAKPSVPRERRDSRGPHFRSARSTG